jgi:hypothetical protein
MKFKAHIVIINLVMVIMLFPMIAYGNSSWHWINTSPLTVLPFAIAFKFDGCDSVV